MVTDEQIKKQLSDEYTTDKLASEHTTGQLIKAAAKRFFSKRTVAMIIFAVTSVTAVIGLSNVRHIWLFRSLQSIPWDLYIWRALAAVVLVTSAAAFFARIGNPSPKMYYRASLIGAAAFGAAGTVLSIRDFFGSTDLSLPQPHFIEILGDALLKNIPFYAVGLAVSLLLGRFKFFSNAKD